MSQIDQIAPNMGKLPYGVGHERDIIRGRAAAVPGRARIRAARGPSAARADAARTRRGRVERPRPGGHALAGQTGKSERGGDGGGAVGRQCAGRLGHRTRGRFHLAGPRAVVGRRPGGLHTRVRLPAARRLRLAEGRHSGRGGRGDAYVRRTARPRSRAGHPATRSADPPRPRSGRPYPAARAARRPRPHRSDAPAGPRTRRTRRPTAHRGRMAYSKRNGSRGRAGAMR